MSASEDPILLPYRYGPHHVPGYWQFLLPPEARVYRLPKERRATCANCPMVEARGFRPDYRCCTYLPLVPGFAIGLALQEGGPRGRLEALIDQGHMTPEGLHPSPLARFHARRQDALGLYGKGETLCPLLDAPTGQCGIYAFRNGVCSTFFCVHDHGLVGDQFWSGLRDLVCQLETALHQWALREVGFDLEAYMQALDGLADDPLGASDPLSRGWRPAVLDRLWADWRGRERELFLATAREVSARRQELHGIATRQRLAEPLLFEAALARLSSDDLLAEVDVPTLLGSSPVAAHVELTGELHEALWSLPDPDVELRLNPAVTVDVAAGRLRFDEADDYWELDLSAEEAEAVLFFSAPRSLRLALTRCPELARLADPRAFLAECLANQVLYNGSDRG
jgi:Fe-S-cluster containining protein